MLDIGNIAGFVTIIAKSCFASYRPYGSPFLGCRLATVDWYHLTRDVP
jgi:hypothetical protein